MTCSDRAECDARRRAAAELVAGPDHTHELLRQAGSSWRATGAQWEQVFTQLREQASRDDVLEGQTGAAVRGRAYDDWVIVQGKVFQLQEAAEISELGVDRLAGAQAHALDAVEQARAAGFEVNEDLSVTDTQTGGSPAQRAARQTQAETHAAYVQHCVDSLVAVDSEVTAKLTAATQGLGNVAFDESPIPGIDDDQTPQDAKHAGVQLTGYGTPLPEEPPPSDPGLPQPPGGWSDERVMDDAQHIAYGHAWEHWKNVPGMTKDQLAQLVYDMLTGNPKTDLDLFVGQDQKGSTFIYKNGTLVIYDPNNTGDFGTVFKPDDGFDYFLRRTHRDGVRPEAPIISQAPQLPPMLDHPLPAPPRLDPGHPPVTVPPTRSIDPATLPPWLKDPSPPGFQLTPSQPPTIFAWDVPDPPAPPAHPPVSAPAHSGPAITGPAPQDAAKAGAGVLAVVGGLLGLLAHPSSQLTPAP